MAIRALSISDRSISPFQAYHREIPRVLPDPKVRKHRSSGIDTRLNEGQRCVFADRPWLRSSALML
jgi:hypothetical protein